MSGIKEMMDSIPIENRIRVLIEMSLLDAIFELGYRKEGWSESKEDEAMLSKIGELSKRYSNHIMSEYKEWEANGRPTKRKKLKEN